MVNYRRVVCEVAVLAALVVASQAAPAPDCKHATHYDQRQNGTDNVRVHVDGVVVAVLPAESLAESLLSAMPDLSDLLDEEDFEIHKPKPPNTEAQNPLLISIPPSKPEEKPQPTPDKEGAAESSSVKPAESSSEASAAAAVPPPKHQKKAQYMKQRKAERVKNYLASFLIPLLRKNRHH